MVDATVLVVNNRKGSAYSNSGYVNVFSMSHSHFT